MKRSDERAAAGAAVFAAGSAVIAFAGTLCCAGPAVVSLLGAGGALAAARLEPYRPYFLAVSAVMLAFGFWRVYRRPACVDGECAARPPRWLRFVLWASLAATVASVVAPHVW